MRYLQAVGQCVPEAFDALVALADDGQFEAWAAQWGFTHPWALDFARRHAPFWREHPEVTGRAMAGSVTSWEPVFPAGPSWNPINETETSYRARVEAYIGSLQQLPGMSATPVKRNADDHFEWLALHHVGGWTYDRIAERYQNEITGNPNTAAIGHAIKQTSALISLTLRSARGRKSS